MKISIDYKFSNWNEIINKSRTNYYLANNSKKKEMDIVRYYLIGVKPITEYPIKMTFTWHCSNKKRDLDNMSCKNLLDQMQLSGVLKNDNMNCIQEITHKVIFDGDDSVDIEWEKINN